MDRLQLQMHNFMPMSDKQEIEDSKKSHFMNQLNRNMQDFWRERQIEIQEGLTEEDLLPSTRTIREIMKSDGEVKMISADTVVVFKKASEIFIKELTLRAWMHAQEYNGGTLESVDITKAIKDDHVLSFLDNIVPNDESFFARLLNQEMEEDSSSRSSPPSTPVDEDDPYIIFKNFFGERV